MWSVKQQVLSAACHDLDSVHVAARNPNSRQLLASGSGSGERH